MEAAVGLVIPILVLIVGSTVLWVWALIDSIQHPDWPNDRAGSNKTLRIILIVWPSQQYRYR